MFFSSALAPCVPPFRLGDPVRVRGVSWGLAGALLVSFSPPLPPEAPLIRAFCHPGGREELARSFKAEALKIVRVPGLFGRRGSLILNRWPVVIPYHALFLPHSADPPQWSWNVSLRLQETQKKVPKFKVGTV